MKKGVTAGAVNRLHPVGFFAGRRLRAEIRVHRTVGVRNQILVLAADAWEALDGMDHGAGLVAADND